MNQSGFNLMTGFEAFHVAFTIHVEALNPTGENISYDKQC